MDRANTNEQTIVKRTHLRINISVEQGAEGRLLEVVGRVERPRDVVELGEEEVGRGGDEGDEPDEGDDAHGALEARHGVRVERVADGQVALHREGHDRQHRGVRRPGRSSVKIYNYELNAIKLLHFYG